MINVVFEGSNGTDKKELIKNIKKIYNSKNYKVGMYGEIDRKSKTYKIFEKNVDNYFSSFLNKASNDAVQNVLAHTIDYMYLRDKMYSNNDDINIFERSYISIYTYYSVFLLKNIKERTYFMDNLLNFLKNKEKKIDLMVYFDVDFNKNIKCFNKNNRKVTKKEKQLLKEVEMKLKDFIRYNNSEYNLLVIENNDSENVAVEKITKKLDEILEDNKKTEDAKWYELYKIDIEEFHTPDDYIEYKLKYKKKFIEKVIQYSQNKKVIEMGCGTGLMAGYLQKLGLDVTALDLSQKVLDYAYEIAKQSNIIKPCKYEQGDILNLKYKAYTFDVSYSNGVLEHFNDDEVVTILKQQMKISKYVIFGVPSTYFNMNEKMLGNERSLTLREWSKLVEKAGGYIIEQTSFHYYKLYRRIFEVKKWFKPKAFWLFIIENDKIGKNAKL